MGDLSEFSRTVQLVLRTYRWRRIDPVPWAAPRRPLAECRVALVTSAGFTTPDQVAFDESVRGGDPSFRILGADVNLTTLIESHRSASFDHSGVAADPNLAFPLDRLHEMARDGVIGSVAPRHVSVMGSLLAVGRFVRDTAPAIATMFVEDQVDVALLVPV